MEKHLQELQNQIQDLPDEQLNKSPAEGKWSVIQILHHLIDAESGTLAYIKKKTLAPEKMGKVGIKEKLNAYLLKFYLVIPIKWKAPKVVDKVPEFVSYSDTRERYHRTRNKWNEFIENVPEDWLDKKIFRHPISGRMDLYDTLDFLHLHALRHFKQIQRLVEINNKQ